MIHRGGWLGAPIMIRNTLAVPVGIPPGVFRGLTWDRKGKERGCQVKPFSTAARPARSHLRHRPAGLDPRHSHQHRPVSDGSRRRQRAIGGFGYDVGGHHFALGFDLRWYKIAADGETMDGSTVFAASVGFSVKRPSRITCSRRQNRNQHCRRVDIRRVQRRAVLGSLTQIVARLTSCPRPTHQSRNDGEGGHDETYRY